MNPARKRPTNGERILICRHGVDTEDGFHIFHAPVLVSMKRGDGSGVSSRWLLACPDCFEKKTANPEFELPIARDGWWIGNRPNERKPK